MKKEGKKSDIKARKRKSVMKKVVTIVFRPNREKMAQRMCLSEHPFGTIKRTQASYYFLLNGNQKTQGEFALYSLCYNLKRMLNIFGYEKMMEIITFSISIFFQRIFLTKTNTI